LKSTSAEAKQGPDGFAYANFEGHQRLVKLNHANGQVLDWAVDVAKFWIERGIDGFRLDAAYAIPPISWRPSPIGLERHGQTSSWSAR
jgi:glycosidase